MSGPLFEQYKSALRRGHLSALAGMLDDALEAYVEAARLAPERPLPFANQATILHRLDRWPEAAEAFDHALGLAPDDAATLRARGTARGARGMQSGAAADFERLANVLDATGQPTEALDAARRAVSLEPSPSRTSLASRLTASASHTAPAAPPTDVQAGFPELIPPADPAAIEAELAAMAELVVPDPVPAPAAPLAAPHTVGGGAIAEGKWPAVDLPTPPPPPLVGPPPDPDVLMNDAATALDAGDVSAARDLMLTAVMVHRSAGHLDAALDCCLQLLAIAPGEPQAHLAIANLQLDHGWTALATEKIDLLLRLTALTGDTQAEADAHGLAAERLRDEPAPPVSVR